MEYYGFNSQRNLSVKEEIIIMTNLTNNEHESNFAAF